MGRERQAEEKNASKTSEKMLVSVKKVSKHKEIGLKKKKR
jgi:hypothetical protein